VIKNRQVQQERKEMDPSTYDSSRRYQTRDEFVLSGQAFALAVDKRFAATLPLAGNYPFG